VELQSVDDDIHLAYDATWDFPIAEFEESTYDFVNFFVGEQVYLEVKWSSSRDWSTKNVYK